MAARVDPTPKRASSLTLRLVSAAILIPIVLLAAYFGFPFWDALVIVFSGTMIWEWCRIVSRPRDPATGLRLPAKRPWPETSIATTLLVVLLACYDFAWTSGRMVPSFWFALALGAVLAILVAAPRYRAASLWFGLGFAYVAIACGAIIGFRSDPNVGLAQILWIVALVIAADTGAYAAGRSIGGPKLAPRISPNKTWAGLGGAIVSAAVAGGIVAAVLGIEIWKLAVLSGGLAILEQIGDLAESALKRRFGVKDSGNIIPGHGGALDRVDGLMAVAVAVAVLNSSVGSSVLTWL